LGQTSNVISLQVTTTAPGIFTQNEQGTGPGAFNSDFSLNGPNNPVAPGGSVVLYLTGEGQTTPLGVTGTINSSTSLADIPKPLLPVTVTLGGQTLPESAIEYVGGVPGEVEGITQLNIKIPTNASPGSLPIVVTIGANNSQSGVTVSVQ
jgi:trimeric autotransporter adhesin